MELQDGETRADQIEALHPACREGRCTQPEEEGGLGAVELHPLNEMALGFYAQCCALTPAVALALDDLGWHPDRALLARQLTAIVAERGAPWLPAREGPADR